MQLLTGDESASFALVGDLVRAGASTSTSTSTSTSASASASASVADVLAAAREVATSALMLSMWLADDLSLSQPPVAPDVKWAFPFSSLVSQPIRLALAFRMGFDAFSRTGGGGGGDGLSRSVLLPVNMRDRLRHSLGGKSVIELLHMTPAAADDDDDDGAGTAGAPRSADPSAGAGAAAESFAPISNNDYSAYLSSSICTRVREVRGVSSVAVDGREEPWWVETRSETESAASLDAASAASLLEQLSHELCRRGIDPTFVETGREGGENGADGHEVESAVSAESPSIPALAGNLATRDDSASVCLVTASLYFPVTQVNIQGAHVYMYTLHKH
jgi:hypothetical protein